MDASLNNARFHCSSTSRSVIPYKGLWRYLAPVWEKVTVHSPKWRSKKTPLFLPQGSFFSWFLRLLKSRIYTLSLISGVFWPVNGTRNSDRLRYLYNSFPIRMMIKSCGGQLSRYKMFLWARADGWIRIVHLYCVVYAGVIPLIRNKKPHRLITRLPCV